MKITNILFGLSVLCVSQFAQATVIYDESVSGDMGAAAGASPVWELMLGMNSIIGTTTVDDSDDFIVRAESGLEITGGVFEALFSGSGTGFYNSSGIPVVGGGIFQGIIGGDTTVEIDSFAIGLFSTQRSSADADITYRYDFNVVDPNAVPGPSTLALLCLGIIGIIFRKVKK
jgi:hypothetical protein